MIGHAGAANAQVTLEATGDSLVLTVSVEGEQRIPANRALLRRALVNLLTNASRHAPEGATLTVRIELWGDADGARMSVLNPGDPIPEDVRWRMFDRFRRGEASPVKSGDRFGLGLAIVRAVARMHGGETFVDTHGADALTQIGFKLRRRAWIAQ